MFSIESLVRIVVYLIVIGAVFGLLNYLIDNVPMFEPYKKVAKIVLLVLGVLVLIGLLLSLVGGGPVLIR